MLYYLYFFLFNHSFHFIPHCIFLHISCLISLILTSLYLYSDLLLSSIIYDNYVWNVIFISRSLCLAACELVKVWVFVVGGVPCGSCCCFDDVCFCDGLNYLNLKIKMMMNFLILSLSEIFEVILHCLP